MWVTILPSTWDAPHGSLPSVHGFPKPIRGQDCAVGSSDGTDIFRTKLLAAYLSKGGDCLQNTQKNPGKAPTLGGWSVDNCLDDQHVARAASPEPSQAFECDHLR